MKLTFSLSIIIMMTFETILSFSQKTLIEAHRGVSNEEDENTLASFQKAIDYNIDGIETDAWLTKDNVVVLIHDGKEINKTYNIIGNEIDVTKLSWSTLKNFKTKKNNHSMPTLDEAMKLTKNKIFLNLEIKDNRINLIFPEIIKLIEKNQYFGQISISSFNHEYYKSVLQYNKKYNRNTTFGFLYSHNLGISNKYKNHRIIMEHRFITKNFVEDAHKNGMKVIAWYFAKGGWCLWKGFCLLDLIGEDENLIKKTIKSLIYKGVDEIITSYPKIAKELRDSYYEFGYEEKNEVNWNFYISVFSSIIFLILIIILFKKYFK